MAWSTKRTTRKSRTSRRLGITRTALSKSFALSPSLTFIPVFTFEDMYRVESGHHDISVVADGTLSLKIDPKLSVYGGARVRHHFDALGPLVEGRVGMNYNLTDAMTLAPEAKCVHGSHTAAHDACVGSVSVIIKW